MINPQKNAAKQKLWDRKEGLRENEREIKQQNKALEECTRAIPEAKTERAKQWKEEWARAMDWLRSFSLEANTVDVMTTASMRCKRQHLKNKEAKMAVHNKVLEEVIYLNWKREAKIKRRMANKIRQALIDQK